MPFFLLSFLLNQSALYLIDLPNSRVLGHGEYEIALRFGPDGGVLGYFQVGVIDRFAFGLSTGAANLIGAKNPDFYPHPGIQIKAQILTGGLALPEWAIGFDNQGFGEYENHRYLIKSRGFYSTLGKGFEFEGGEFYINGGINFSLEREDKSSLDIFLGSALSIIDFAALKVDYDPALNDPISKESGYLNLGLQINLAESVAFEFALRDILGSGEEELNRIIKLSYRASF